MVRSLALSQSQDEICKGQPILYRFSKGHRIATLMHADGDDDACFKGIFEALPALLKIGIVLSLSLSLSLSLLSDKQAWESQL